MISEFTCLIVFVYVYGPTLQLKSWLFLQACVNVNLINTSVSCFVHRVSNSPEASWIESLEDSKIIEDRKDPTSKFQQEESKIRFNAARALEDFASRSS